jgi:hypothetical protein
MKALALLLVGLALGAAGGVIADRLIESEDVRIAKGVVRAHAAYQECVASIPKSTGTINLTELTDENGRLLADRRCRAIEIEKDTADLAYRLRDRRR